MWLLPVFSAVSRFCLRVYYRVEVDGPPPPAAGPLLLIANHPNSLLDPACVVAYAGRPVRFLAKAPLFAQKDIGWLIRGAGAIPVHRRQDDPSRLGENEQTFRAAEQALAEGAAVGIFPEGITHDEPRLTPLKTGGARIALGAAVQLGGSFPIIPIGLSFPEKAIFRSDALVVRGEPILWADLAGKPPEDIECVRELTRRMEEGLLSVTLNLERWEDREIVLGAEAIYAAQRSLDASHARRMERLRITTDHLRELRRIQSPAHEELADGVRRHMMLLGRLGLRPTDLSSMHTAPRGSLGTGVSGIAGAVALGLAWIGGILFYPPYRLTGLVQGFFRPDSTAAATHKMLAGILLFTLWYLLVLAVAAVPLNVVAVVALAIILPVLGLSTLWMRDLSNESLRRARRGWVLQRRRTSIEEMRRRQETLAEALDALLRSRAQGTGLGEQGSGESGVEVGSP